MDGVIFLDRHVDLALREALDDAWDSIGLTTPQGGSAPQFFVALSNTLGRLNGPNDARTVKDVFLHVDYLADKIGISSEALLRGDSFQVEPQQILHDALVNISAVLRLHAEAEARARSEAEARAAIQAQAEAEAARQAEQAATGLPADIEAVIEQAEQRLQGWCSRQKSIAIAETVLREKPAICVEIGIFGGRSLMPVAAALRHVGSGVIYGIETWDPGAAIVNPTNAANDDWWSQVDFAPIKENFFRFVVDSGLTSQVRVIEATSARAAVLFDTIDFLHIDGSHAMVSAVEDVLNYVRKVRPGGIVLFDDVEWESTGPAQALLHQFCEPVRMLGDVDNNRGLCAVMRRRAEG